jgi:signal peptide peptidase SppA
MKTYAHLFAKLFASPLMLHSPVRQSFENNLLARMRGDVAHQAIPVAQAARDSASPIITRADVGEPGRPMEDWLRQSRDIQATKKLMRLENVYQRYGNVAVVKIHGVIDKVISQFEMDCYGGCDLQDVDNALAQAANDPRITHVVLDLHSPGGSVVGVKETAARIAALRATKEVHAYVAGMACSAGYYLASQADVISAGESAIVGSIGVYIAVLDASRWYAEEGLSVQVLKAGEMKTMGAQWRALTEQEREYLQGSVDGCYADFKAAVTALRNVDDATMQGQWMDASDGYRLKLVDNLTIDTLDEYVAALIG